jgi:hypothetical protein
MHGFPEADPEVDEAEAGEEAADEVVAEEGAEAGHPQDHRVVGPDLFPGKDGEHDADFHAKDDEDDKHQAARPDGTGSVFGGDAGRSAHVGEHRPGMGSIKWIGCAQVGLSSFGASAFVRISRRTRVGSGIPGLLGEWGRRLHMYGFYDLTALMRSATSR